MLVTLFFETTLYVNAKEAVPLTHRKYFCMGWDSVVSEVTCCGLNGVGIESRWSEIFCVRPDQPWGPPSLLYSGYWVSFLGSKATREWQ